MFDDTFVPFYRTLGEPALYAGEQLQEKEHSLLKSWYPDTVRRIQEIVEEECGRQDYEGSRIYDEYPDRRMLRAMSAAIGKKVETEFSTRSVPYGTPGETAEILFYQEIYRRRCRRGRCRGY